MGSRKNTSIQPPPGRISREGASTRPNRGAIDRRRSAGWPAAISPDPPKLVPLPEDHRVEDVVPLGRFACVEDSVVVGLAEFGRGRENQRAPGRLAQTVLGCLVRSLRRLLLDLLFCARYRSHVVDALGEHGGHRWLVHVV